VAGAESPPTAREGAPHDLGESAPTGAGSATQPGPELRLSITKSGIGLEIGGPIPLACASVTELWLRLPQVRFPFDVSGGVARFRHKRGALTRLALELDWDDAARWMATRASGLVAPGAAEVLVAGLDTGSALVTVRSRPRSPDEPVAALAFEVSVLPRDEGLDVVVHGARGAGLRALPTLLAITAVGRWIGRVSRRRGAIFHVADAAAMIARDVLPDAGARVPEVASVTLSVCSITRSGGLLVFAEGAPSEPSRRAVRAWETADNLASADDALASADLEQARRATLVALDRAPRQGESSRRLAEIDAHHGGRAEAALGTLRDSADADGDALLRGDLLLETGDTSGAVAAWTTWASVEPSPWVAALAFAKAARATDDGEQALAWLDSAVAAAPTVPHLRWLRAGRRLEGGRVAEGIADLEHLEAMAVGARDKHESARRAAQLLARAGLSAESTRFLERALRFDPADPIALAGLGVALSAAGRPARGAALLSRAIDEATARREPVGSMLLDLARILGGALEDLPSAIARARTVPDDADGAWAARALEGNLRARLGDVEGASLAYARMRELAATSRDRAAVTALVEAAEHERARGEQAAERRHLTAALALSPHDAALLARTREIGDAHRARATQTAEPPTAAREETAPAPSPAPAVADAPSEPGAALEAPAEPSAEEPFDEGAADARVAVLTMSLQADPTNDATVDELVSLLTRLGRYHELLALLSARLEDAPADRREALLPKQRAILAELAEHAEREGRADEAALFRMVRETL
jgi:cellulose synthase operon protein C